MNRTLDTSSLASDLIQGKPVALTFRFPNEDAFLTINALIAKTLSRCNLKFLIDTCITVVREIVLNAIKANAKRVFFKKINLDIHDPAGYKIGMMQFRDMITDFNSIKDEITASAFRITITMIKKDDHISITVNNNASMTNDESDRLRQRIEVGSKDGDFNDMYETVQDASEGAGLGIILSLLLLKNAGFDLSGFVLKSEKESTSIEFRVPLEPRKMTVESEIKLRIIDEIESLPTFPEHIMELQALCDNPESSINAITKKIHTDPSLAADVLKIANSAGFITGKRIESISDAVIIIGMRNLKSILVATASRRILDSRYKRYESIWDHCNRAAFYGRAIAELTGNQKISDQVFIAGLLHDIGKIALLAADETLVAKIGTIAGGKRAGTTAILEEVSIGISHTTIGRMVAEKWNFPEFITAAIDSHHSPMNAPGKYRNTVTLVYLANMLCEIDQQNFDMSFIEMEILESLGLADRGRFHAFAEEIRKRHREHSSSQRKR